MLFNTKTSKKQVFYETMDEKEIKYLKEYGKNSNKFISLHNQIEKANKDGIFAEVK